MYKKKKSVRPKINKRKSTFVEEKLSERGKVFNIYQIFIT